MDAGSVVEDGHFDITKWFIEEYEWNDPDNRSDWIVESLESTARIGNMAMVLYAQGKLDGNEVNIIYSALLSGKTDIVQWLHDCGGGGDSMIMDQAVQSGSLELVRWVHATYRNQDRSPCSIDNAAKYDLDIVQFLHEHRRGR